jgi:hypothetical protein
MWTDRAPVNGFTDGPPAHRYDRFTRDEMISSIDEERCRRTGMGGPSRELQEKIDRLHQQAQADPVLARAFDEDPQGTLQANGIETSGLTFGDHVRDEVAGYMRKAEPDNCICLRRGLDDECSVWFCF